MFAIGAGSLCLGHTDVTPAEALGMIQNDPNLVVVDVRELSEYCDVNGHIPGALIYPYSSGVLAERYGELRVDRNYLIVCRSGGRSNAAATFLDNTDFLDATDYKIYDMTGGMNSWQWDRVGCVDSDGDKINDDLDNCPGLFNPKQMETVTFADFALLAGQWHQSGAGVLGDIDHDGVVNLSDFLIFALHWLDECAVE